MKTFEAKGGEKFKVKQPVQFRGRLYAPGQKDDVIIAKAGEVFADHCFEYIGKVECIKEFPSQPEAEKQPDGINTKGYTYACGEPNCGYVAKTKEKLMEHLETHKKRA